MNFVNTFFDNVFVVNLKRRPDRAEHTTNEMKLHEINFEFYEACDGNIEFEEWKKTHSMEGFTSRQKLDAQLPFGKKGCATSMTGVVKEAKRRGYKQILVFEDDVEFLDDFNMKAERYLKELPSNWGFLFLSGGRLAEHQQRGKWSERYSDHAYRIEFIHALCAWGIQEHLYDEFIKWGETAANEYKHIDEFLASSRSKFFKIVKPFVCNECITGQNACQSDIGTRNTNGFYFRNDLDLIHGVLNEEENEMKQAKPRSKQSKTKTLF